MLKNLLLFFSIFLLSITSSSAAEVIFYNPVHNWNQLWWVNWNNITRTELAERFCLEQWQSYSYISHVNDWISQNGLWAIRNFNNTDWQTTWYKNDWYSNIICDDWVNQNTNNNINWPTNSTFSSSWSIAQTFLDIDYTSLTYSDTFIETGTWETISYTHILQDQTQILYQILYVLTTLTFFMCLWIFYSFINDLLWKK